MKRIAILLTLVAGVLSLNSCGLPMAAARTAGNVVNSAAGLVGGY